MTTYQSTQEWNNLFWGTAMPVTIVIGSNLAQVRAYGKCSFAVADPARLEERVSDPDQLTPYVKSLLMTSFSDAIGERSGEFSDMSQLTAITSQIIQELRTKVEPRLYEIGLRLNSVSIEKIESI